MPRIALLTPYLPAPAFSGGRIRILELAQGLFELGEIHLFSQAGLKERKVVSGSRDLQQFASVCAESRWFPPLMSSALPKRVLLASPPRLEAQFRRSGSFDLVVVEHSHAARLPLAGGSKILLDEHNVESHYLQEKLGDQAGRRARREVMKLEKWEEHVWRNVCQVVAVTEEDAQRIAQHTARPPVVIPNGVKTREIRLKLPSERRGAEILFVGLLNHPPNVKAAHFLARRVMPLVWAEVPEAKLILCGANPAREVSALSEARIKVTGRVPSVHPFLEQARVYAMPLEGGAGSSLKVLEALASGLPLVATKVAVRGFRLEPQVDYLQAETPESFARELLSILAPPQEGAVGRSVSDDDRARRGRALAEQHDWSLLRERYRDLALEVLRLPP